MSYLRCRFASGSLLQDQVSQSLICAIHQAEDVSIVACNLKCKGTRSNTGRGLISRILRVNLESTVGLMMQYN